MSITVRNAYGYAVIVDVKKENDIISNIENGILAMLGTGDIAVATTTTVDSLPAPIIHLEFTDIESIDVVIEALEAVKKRLARAKREGYFAWAEWGFANLNVGIKEE